MAGGIPSGTLGSEASPGLEGAGQSSPPHTRRRQHGPGSAAWAPGSVKSRLLRKQTSQEGQEPLMLLRFVREMLFSLGYRVSWERKPGETGTSSVLFQVHPSDPEQGPLHGRRVPGEACCPLGGVGSPHKPTDRVSMLSKHFFSLFNCPPDYYPL